MHRSVAVANPLLHDPSNQIKFPIAEGGKPPRKNAALVVTDVRRWIVGERDAPHGPPPHVGGYQDNKKTSAGCRGFFSIVSENISSRSCRERGLPRLRGGP